MLYTAQYYISTKNRRTGLRYSREIGLPRNIEASNPHKAKKNERNQNVPSQQFWC